jgi:hypothetical protein
MDNFFIALKKTLVAIVFVVFGFVGTYIPQNWDNTSNIQQAEAAWATLPLQILQQGQLLLINAATTITSLAAAALEWKEFTLDGLAWAFAKKAVNMMVQSLINWINSGFKGSPSFVQDLEGFLTNAADAAVVDYLLEIEAIDSFICEPFRLDVSIAIKNQYRLGRDYQSAPDCTLTGIIDNIKGFTSGAQGSFSEGGWDDWLEITTQPEVYTAYGAALTAEAGARARIINAKGEELSILDFGDGFLSMETCKQIPGSAKKDCWIDKPGKIIQEALTFNLDSGRQALIQADEISEIIAALLGQFANMAITGAKGLLGLGGSTGSVTGDRNPSFNYTPAGPSVANPAITLSLMQNARTTQKNYNTVATDYRAKLLLYAADPTNTPAQQAAATAAANNAQVIITNTSSDIITLNQLIADFSDPAATPAIQNAAIASFNGLTLYTDADISSSQTAWATLLK